MKTLSVLLLTTIMVVLSTCTQKEHKNFVFVKGGTFMNTESNFFGEHISISDFYMGKYEVTQKEWVEIMGNNPSQFKGDDLPVENVSWYDCVEYCNERSVKEGFIPYYNIDKNIIDANNRSEYDSIKWTVTINAGSNGYRLPTEAKWEYAASGGQKSKSYSYSGSNKIDEVAWYWKNSGDERLTGDWHWMTLERNNNRTKPVGGKKPNELGLYDMSGNVREWCWDWYIDLECNPSDPYGDNAKVWRGGGWIGGEHACVSNYRGKFEANGKGPDQGFRVCRSIDTF